MRAIGASGLYPLILEPQNMPPTAFLTVFILSQPTALCHPPRLFYVWKFLLLATERTANVTSVLPAAEA